MPQSTTERRSSMTEWFSRLVRRTVGTLQARRVLILLALCGLAIGGSAAGASADTAPAASPAASFQRACGDPLPGQMACFALRRTTGVVAAIPTGVNPAAVVSGYGPADLDQRVQAADEPRLGQDRRDRRRLRRPERRERPRDLPQPVRPAGVHDGQRLLPQGQPERRDEPAADRRTRAGPSEITLDLDMVSATCPQCKILLVEANSPTNANLGTAVNQAVAQGAVAVSNSYGGPESSSDPSIGTTYYKHPGVAITVSSGDSGYGVEFPASSPYVTSVGGTSLDDGEQRARLDGDGLVDLGDRRRRQRLLDATRRSRRSSPTPAARGGRSPTCRRSPTRPPASPSTTASARAAGRCSAARACRRRSSRPSTRSRRRRRPASIRLSTRTPTRAPSST